MLANEGQGLAATLHDFIRDGYPREEAQSEVRRLRADKEYADNEIAKAECKLDATADKHFLVANLRRAAAKGLKSIFHGQPKTKRGGMGTAPLHRAARRSASPFPWANDGDGRDRRRRLSPRSLVHRW